ncbi:predicted protein [Naegleria gruberi]|uniref:Predicted protein n=1 Tax=Naegleria gruberi TaxID=5762 RepID=D2V270_NAEGR|nr:uncharacterized protein NAEGRDRAFT_46092 [Naegleria gruberi]EFC48999.1 predicted protein [Naegleria gruberi]|eukprot:XP_002681743.1 predicted protein [Naegleria gruberi strain NEG-M]
MSNPCFKNQSRIKSSTSRRRSLLIGCIFIMTVILCLLPSGIWSEFNEDSYTRMIDKFGYLKSVITSKRKPIHHHHYDNSIEEIFDTIYLRNNETLDYGVVVVIDKLGKVIFKKAYGTREPTIVGAKRNMKDPLDDIFPISEVSATFTAATSVQLYEMGILENLSTTQANVYLPDPLKIKKDIIGDYSSTLDLPVKISSDNVTLGSLLTHTTGFDSRVVGSCSRVDDSSEKNEPEHFLKKYLEIMDVPRIRRYDFVSSFSHIGYTMLALIIERVTGQSMKHNLENHIFKPLNMSSTFDRYKKNIFDSENLVLPFLSETNDKEEIYGRIYDDYCWYTPAFSSSVGMYSTPRDMAKWALTHLNYGEIIPSELDPHVERKRIFSKESAELMYSEHFSSHPNCSITTGYGWNIEKKSDVKYITAHGSFMHPFFSRLAVFHEQGLGIAILGRGKDIRWDLGFDLFVDRYVDRVPCSMRKSPLNTTYVDNDLGICAFTMKISSLPKFSEEYNYITKYSGCYVMHEYEHTTWLKFRKEFQKKICVSVEDNHLYISTGERGIQLVALEMPGRTLENDPLFIAGIKYDDEVLIVDGFSDISFEFNEGDESASYITLASVPFERATPVNFYALLLTLGFSFLICFSFSLLHLSFCIHTWREHNAMYSKRKASILINRVASLQRPIGPLSSSTGSITIQDSDTNIVGVDEEGRQLLYSYGDDEEAMNGSEPTTTVKSSKIHKFIKIKSIVDTIAILLMSCTTLNNSLALIGIIMNYSLFNQTKLFPQEQFGIQFFLLECQLAVVFDFAIVLALLALFVVQMTHPKGKSRRVWLWVVMYAVSTFIHLVWLAFCIYFNWFGPDYQTI